MIYDYCIIGGGIVGLATAMALLERQPGAAQGRVCPPEPVASAKIGQPRIHPHACTACDQQAIGFHDAARSLKDDRVLVGSQGHDGVASGRKSAVGAWRRREDTPRFEAGTQAAGSTSPTITTCRKRGPCAPSTRLPSMSVVPLGPVTMLTLRGGRWPAVAAA